MPRHRIHSDSDSDGSNTDAGGDRGGSNVSAGSGSPPASPPRSNRALPPEHLAGPSRDGGKHHRRGRTPETLPMSRRRLDNNTLEKILDNQQAILQRLSKVEEMLSQQNGQRGRGRAQGAPRPEVPNDVRGLVRQGYDYAVNNAGKTKWNLTKGMKSTSVENQATTQSAMEYVQGIMPGYAQKVDIVKAAVDTYFQSKARDDKRSKEGKVDKHRKRCGRNTRINSKLDHRLKALKAKTSYRKNEKDRLLRVLTADNMSSEESDNDENGEKFFKVKAIPWQSAQFTKYKRELDQKFELNIQGHQAKRQTLKRVPGPPSTAKAKKPSLAEEDAWIAI